MGIFDFLFNKNKYKKQKDDENDYNLMPGYVLDFLEDAEKEAENIKQEKLIPFDKDKYNIYLDKLSNGEKLNASEWEEYCILGSKAVQIEQDNSDNPKFHRTEIEEELKHKFSKNYQDKISLYEDKIYGDCKFENIKSLEDRINSFDIFKKFAYSKGEGGKLYFQDMWEHNHNSQRDCYSYRETLVNNLNNLIELRDLPDILLSYIKNNDKTLQKDIYNSLSDYKKSNIQEVLRKLEKENKIKRTKFKNSYLLELY